MTSMDKILLELETLNHKQYLNSIYSQDNKGFQSIINAKSQTDIYYYIMRYLPQIEKEIEDRVVNRVLQSINTKVEVNGLEAIKKIDGALRQLGR